MSPSSGHVALVPVLRSVVSNETLSSILKSSELCSHYITLETKSFNFPNKMGSCICILPAKTHIFLWNRSNLRHFPCQPCTKTAPVTIYWQKSISNWAPDGFGHETPCFSVLPAVRISKQAVLIFSVIWSILHPQSSESTCRAPILKVQCWVCINVCILLCRRMK